jgi:predicted ArsR family transcriptional regulator
MRIVKLMIGRTPITVASLIRATGVTRTAVTEQLNELVAAGFVQRTTERLIGRGRPRHLYSATNNALLLLFAGNQHFLVPAIWQAVADLGGDELVRKIQRRTARTMAEHYRPRVRGHTPAERLKEMMRLLNEEGGIVEVQQGNDGRLVLYRRSCPFFSMFEERTKAVCCIDQEMISEIVGAPVRRTACRHDGAPCCTFEIPTSNENSTRR